MKRRTFFSLAGAYAGAFSAGCTQRPKPNVLLLLTDDQRADTIGVAGNPHIRTPNLDFLAGRGLRFDNAYCMGGNSPAVCTPSRNMLLSGRAYTRYEQQASAAAPNFAVAMREAGYQTYHHGKRGNSATEIQAEFETCKYVDEHAARESGAPGRIIADEAIEFLSGRSSDKPFFMYLAFEAPHDPRVPTPQDREYYQRNPPPLPRNFLPQHPFDNGEMTVRDELLARWPRTPAEITSHLSEYYAVITGLDTQIGRLLQAMEERGDDRNTLIIFASDQGLAVGSHGLMGKQNLYDHSMKVPLLIAGPGIGPGRSDALVYLTDLFPTALDFIGTPVPSGLDGRSFRPCLRDPGTPARHALLLGYRSCQRAIRDNRFKLIVYPEINRQQLFDLVSDPDERNDLSENPSYGERKQSLLAGLRELQSQFGDSLPLFSEHPRPAEWHPPEGDALNEIRKRWKMPPVGETAAPNI
jgi:arylsulfatase A-like enzyme